MGSKLVCVHRRGDFILEEYSCSSKLGSSYTIVVDAKTYARLAFVYDKALLEHLVVRTSAQIYKELKTLLPDALFDITVNTAGGLSIYVEYKQYKSTLYLSEAKFNAEQYVQDIKTSQQQHEITPERALLIDKLVAEERCSRLVASQRLIRYNWDYGNALHDTDKTCPICGSRLFNMHARIMDASHLFCKKCKRMGTVYSRDVEHTVHMERS